MPLANTPEKFGLIAKSFHWVMAVLILGMLSVGYIMTSMESSPAKIQLVLLHKSFGVLVLILACGRLAWRFISPRPEPEPTLKAWEIQLSKLVHFFLYVAIFAMPLSGWIMSAAGQYPVSFFGLFNLPQIVPKDRDLLELSRDIHNTLAVVILALLALHFAGAAKHHVIDHDDTVRHMTFDKLSWKAGVALLAVLGILYLVPVSLNLFGGEKEAPPPQAAEQITEPVPVAPFADEVPQPETPQQAEKAPVPAAPVQNSNAWIMDPAVSFIKFSVMQSGTPLTGEFKHFTANIVFDPKSPRGSHAEIEIPIADMTTGSADRDKQGMDKDWFDVKEFPKATYTARSIESQGTNRYVAHGTLNIRGAELPQDLPFTMDISKDAKPVAEMKAELKLNRLDFGIGQGAWKKTDVIENAVKISIYVKATKASP